MKKEKLNLDQIKVDSFVTEAKHLKGGAAPVSETVGGPTELYGPKGGCIYSCVVVEG
ncbi:pinensin family lanthipeptide [Roseivirga sp. BDSF3-8]|uniref:pinensin family lanthipeptide n=1 Tax=Roseivirga sp. BDSF3-8 TaxID=3241598 RepID=UPI003531BCCA